MSAVTFVYFNSGYCMLNVDIAALAALHNNRLAFTHNLKSSLLAVPHLVCNTHITFCCRNLNRLISVIMELDLSSKLRNNFLWFFFRWRSLLYWCCCFSWGSCRSFNFFYYSSWCFSSTKCTSCGESLEVFLSIFFLTTPYKDTVIDILNKEISQIFEY